MRPLRTLLPLAAAGLLSLVGCRSTEDLGGLRTQVLDRPSRYDLTIVGNSTFLRGTLQKEAREDLADFVARDFARSPADDAAYTIESYYRARGFPFSTVRYELELAPDAKPRLTFVVEEGPRCVIESVQFDGARLFSSKELAKHISGPTTSLLGLGELYYVETGISQARGVVEDLYWENGYLDIKIDAPIVEFSEDRTRARVTYLVHEGRQYRLREIRVTGLEGQELELTRRALEGFVDRPYFPRLAFEVRAKASEHFSRNGYPDARADSSDTLDSESAEVDLEVQVHKGDLVRLSEIRILGNERTRESFIRQRIELQPGDLYNRAAERKAFGELYSTGLFSSISIELVGDGPLRVLRVEVEEGATLSLSGEVGYGAFERGRVIVGISEENIAGTGRALRLEAKLAQRAESLRLFLTDPWTLGKENVLGIVTFYDQRREPSFDRKEIGAGLNVTRRQSRNFRNVYGYEYRLSDAQNISINLPPSAIDDGDNTYISELYLTNLYDSRDSIFLPTGGTWMRLRSEFAPREFGSQLTFARFQGRIARYHPIDEQSLVAWTVQTGLIIPIQSTSEIPLQERFFNGGQNTVRSFRESELGPKDANGNPIGGETYTVLSTEYRRRLFGSLTGALFADAGNVALRTADYFDFADFRLGLGPGLRWLLPIGPLRLDWGINPNPRSDEADWVVQFSVGVAF